MKRRLLICGMIIAILSLSSCRTRTAGGLLSSLESSTMTKITAQSEEVSSMAVPEEATPKEVVAPPAAAKKNSTEQETPSVESRWTEEDYARFVGGGSPDNNNTDIPKSDGSLMIVQGMLYSWSNDISITFYPAEKVTKITIQVKGVDYNSIDHSYMFIRDGLTVKLDLTKHLGGGLFSIETIGCLVTIEGHDLVYDGSVWKKIN